MKLVLGADPLIPPLTGIGRYTLELAIRFHETPEFTSLKLFAYGNFLDFDAAITRAVQPLDSSSGGPNTAQSVLAKSKRLLAKSNLAVQVYSRLTPPIYRQRLKPYASSHIFHGPNFYLPPYDGPKVATLHDLSIFLRPDDHPRARVLFIEKEVKKVIDGDAHLLTDSNQVRNEIIEYFGIEGSRVTAIPIGVDHRFRPRESTELEPTLKKFGLSPQAYCLCVSTLEPRKNLERLLTAYEALPKSLQNAYPLVLIGDKGWKSEALLFRIQGMVSSGQIRYLGYVPDEYMPDLYAGAKGLVFPSLYEGFGLPLLEAMASGTPVLTSSCSSMPEVVAGAGLLVSPFDIDAIGLGIRHLLEDEAWRAEARKAGIHRASDLTWDHCADATACLYRSLLGQ